MNKDDEALLQFFGVSNKPTQQPRPSQPQVRVTARANVSGMSPEEQAIIDAADRYLKGESIKTAAPQPQLKVVQKSGATWKELSGWIAAAFSWAFFTVYLLLGVITK